MESNSRWTEKTKEMVCQNKWAFSSFLTFWRVSDDLIVALFRGVLYCVVLVTLLSLCSVTYCVLCCTRDLIVALFRGVLYCLVLVTLLSLCSVAYSTVLHLWPYCRSVPWRTVLCCTCDLIVVLFCTCDLIVALFRGVLYCVVLVTLLSLCSMAYCTVLYLWPYCRSVPWRTVLSCTCDLIVALFHGVLYCCDWRDSV